MKKTFSFKSEKKAPARQMDAIKSEVNKYIARERRKAVPEGAGFWEFDCRFGITEAAAEVIKFVNISSCITQAFEAGNESFYLEILAKPGQPKKPKAVG